MSTASVAASSASVSSVVNVASPSPSAAASRPIRRFQVACIQMTSNEDMQANIDACTKQIRLAAAAGCKLIATPENTGRMTALTQKNNSVPTSVASSTTPDDPTKLPSPSTPSTPTADTHPVLLSLQSLASELRVYILIGSLAVRVEGESRVANRSYLISPSSDILASCDKIHMFDVPTLNGSETYLESARVLPGSTATLVELSQLAEGACLGMTICYDLRFPQLYRQLAQAGATILAIPSAFTVVTGEAHWHTLLRARAIETGCYVLAPAQSGTHPGQRQTYGHSLIISPWGEILADGGTLSPSFITAEIDLDRVDEARRRVPSLLHDRPFTIVKHGGVGGVMTENTSSRSKL